MLLFEAKEQIDSRIKLIEEEYKNEIPDYLQALEIASKSIEAQNRLADMLNDFMADFNEGDTFSSRLIYDMLSEIRFDYDEDTTAAVE